MIKSFSDAQCKLNPSGISGNTLPAKNISFNQPDVEMLCMTIRDFPLTKTGFDSLRGDKEWVQLQLCVMRVGPPGFSAVPYTASSKKPDSNTKKLYDEDTSTGATRFYAFEKGRTNKDKGPRTISYSSGVEGEDEVAMLPVVVESGVCFNNFVREDGFGDKSFILPTSITGDVLSGGSLVYVQVSSANVEQASKGNLLKVRKIKPVEDYYSALIAGMVTMPDTEHEFEKRMARANESPGLVKTLYGGNMRFCSRAADKTAYTVCVDGEGGTQDFVIFNFTGGKEGSIDEVRIPQKMMLDGMGTYDVQRALKLAIVASAAGALKVIIKVSSVMGSSIGDAMHIYIDVNEMLGLSFIKGLEVWSALTMLTEDSVPVMIRPTADESCAWTLPSISLLVSMDVGDVRHRVFYILGGSEESIEKPWNEGAHNSRLLSDGCIGNYMPLTVVAFPEKEPIGTIFAALGASTDCGPDSHIRKNLGGLRLLKLQFRPENSQGLKKRPRARFSLSDDRDD